jgi:hypothetical protein
MERGKVMKFSPCIQFQSRMSQSFPLCRWTASICKTECGRRSADKQVRETLERGTSCLIGTGYRGQRRRRCFRQNVDHGERCTRWWWWWIEPAAIVTKRGSWVVCHKSGWSWRIFQIPDRYYIQIILNKMRTIYGSWSHNLRSHDHWAPLGWLFRKPVLTYRRLE